MILILAKEEQLDNLLSAFADIEVTDLTVIDGVGMGKVLRDDLPIFAGLRNLMKDRPQYTKILLSAIRDNKKVEEIVSVLRRICGDFEREKSALLLTAPLDGVWGGLPHPAL